MQNLYLSKGAFPAKIFEPTLEYIRQVQAADGAIPWENGAKFDVWDHIESAMGLTIGGDYDDARRAYDWLVRNQMSDGTWWAEYRNGIIVDATRKETNFCAYVATGIWHYYLVTDDKDAALSYWPMVAKAVDFVVSLQEPCGVIPWAGEPDGGACDDALVTGCASIYKSLECAWQLSVLAGEPRQDWLEARGKLGDALRNAPDQFDRTWESKARFSMDWFYPVLTGVYRGQAARARLAKRWDEFVVDGMGCRCVNDEPWVTFAESCELVMALIASGQTDKAAQVYSWLHQWRDDEGAYWMGYQFVEEIVWPEERPTWTAGAILLAADALTHHTGAAELFTSISLSEEEDAFDPAYQIAE